ncbi:hypothetical protein BAR24_00245 [Gluconobacter oxydans]|nr:hypothetical protein BAR24_00245 [Gluconobacter oxydans]
MRNRRPQIRASETKSRLQRFLWNGYGRARSQRPLAATLTAEFQTSLLIIKAKQLLVIGTETFPREKIAQAMIAKAASLVRQLP